MRRLKLLVEKTIPSAADKVVFFSFQLAPEDIERGVIVKNYYSSTAHSNISKRNSRSVTQGKSFGHFLDKLSLKVRIFEPEHDNVNKMISAPSEDLDQPCHPPSLRRVFAVRMIKKTNKKKQQKNKKPLILIRYPLNA